MTRGPVSIRAAHDAAIRPRRHLCTVVFLSRGWLRIWRIVPTWPWQRQRQPERTQPRFREAV